MATNTGQNIRYRILRLLEDEGAQGWGDIRLHAKLTKFPESVVKTELLMLVDAHLVSAVGGGFKISQRGSEHLHRGHTATTNAEGDDE